MWIKNDRLRGKGQKAEGSVEITSSFWGPIRAPYSKWTLTVSLPEGVWSQAYIWFGSFLQNFSWLEWHDQIGNWIGYKDTTKSERKEKLLPCWYRRTPLLCQNSNLGLSTVDTFQHLSIIDKIREKIMVKKLPCNFAGFVLRWFWGLPAFKVIPQEKWSQDSCEAGSWPQNGRIDFDGDFEVSEFAFLAWFFGMLRCLVWSHQRFIETLRNCGWSWKSLGNRKTQVYPNSFRFFQGRFGEMTHSFCLWRKNMWLTILDKYQERLYALPSMKTAQWCVPWTQQKTSQKRRRSFHLRVLKP